MKFKTAYNPNKTIASNAGSRYAPEYKLVKDSETGVEHLEKIGETDTYASIQSFSASVNLGTRLARFMNGDEKALQGANGVYADLRGVPTNYADAARTAVNASAMFDRLPDDVKEAFGNDFKNFKYEYSRGNVDNKIYSHITAKKATEQKEVTNE